MRETAKTMLTVLSVGITLIIAIVANFKYEEWRVEKVADKEMQREIMT